jgi:hypothetical protein
LRGVVSDTHAGFSHVFARLRTKRKHKNEYKNIAIDVMRTKWPSRRFVARASSSA